MNHITTLKIEDIENIIKTELDHPNYNVKIIDVKIVDNKIRIHWTIED